MKKIIRSPFRGLGGVLLLCICLQARSQTQAIQELKLNIEKLAQLKAMLSNMYSGYSILSNGYNNLKNQSLANYNLHKIFIDGLSQISPAVRSAPEIVAILQTQAQIVSEYKTAFQKISGTKALNPLELKELINKYETISTRTSQNLDALKLLLTPRKLQMSEAERINILGSLRSDMETQLQSLRNFVSKAKKMAELRLRLEKENQSLRKTYGLDN